MAIYAEQFVAAPEKIAIDLAGLESGAAVCSDVIDLSADAPQFVLEIELNLGVELPTPGTVQYFIVPASTFELLETQLEQVSAGRLELEAVLKYCRYLGYVVLDASDGCGAIQLRFMPTGERAHLLACNRTAVRFPHKFNAAGHTLQIMPWAEPPWVHDLPSGEEGEEPAWLDDLD